MLETEKPGQNELLNEKQGQNELPFEKQGQNELLFSKKLAENLDLLNKRVFTQRKATLIIIDGAIGEGKTTLAVHIADYINSLHKLPPINLKEETQLALGGEDFLEKITKCYTQKLPVLIYDESGDFGKRGALTKFNNMINRTFEMFRAFQVIVILCLPSFDSLDSSLIDKKIPRMLINVYGRTTRQGNFRGYSYDRIGFLKYRIKKLILKTYCYNYVSPNFYGHFKDLEKSRSKELDRISTKNKLNETKKSAVNYSGLLSYTQIAKNCDRAVQTVKNTVYSLKIKPAKRFNKTPYFTEADQDRLIAHFEGDD